MHRVKYVITILVAVLGLSAIYSGCTNPKQSDPRTAALATENNKPRKFLRAFSMVPDSEKSVYGKALIGSSNYWTSFQLASSEPQSILVLKSNNAIVGCQLQVSTFGDNVGAVLINSPNDVQNFSAGDLVAARGLGATNAPYAADVNRPVYVVPVYQSGGLFGIGRAWHYWGALNDPSDVLSETGFIPNVPAPPWVNSVSYLPGPPIGGSPTNCAIQITMSNNTNPNIKWQTN